MADDVKKSEVLSEQAETAADEPKTATDTAESADRGSAQKKKRVRKKPVKGENLTGGTKGVERSASGADGEQKRKVRKKRTQSNADNGQAADADTSGGQAASPEKVKRKRRPEKSGAAARKARAKTADGKAEGAVKAKAPKGKAEGAVKVKKRRKGEGEKQPDAPASADGQNNKPVTALKGAGASAVAAVKKAVSNIPEKNRKKILGVTASILGVYFVLAFVFTFVFMPRTTLNGLKVSFKSYSSASKMIKPTIKDYVLTVHNLDGSQDKVEGSAVHLKYDSMKWIKEALRVQNQFAWPAAIFKGNDITIEENISYDEDKFESILKKLSGFKTTTMIEPQDAHVAMDETGTYVVYPEVIGTTIDVDAAEAAARECLFTGNKSLNLEDYHILPKVYSDDEKLGERLIEWNDYMKSAGLTYIFWDTPEVLTRDVIDSLITDDGDKLFVDEDKVMNLMAVWREKHDSIGRSFTFTTYEGIEVEIEPGGDYGYELNEEAVCADIIEKLEAHDTGSYEVSYWRKPLAKTNNGLGGTYIEVSLTDQHMWMYEDGELVIDTPVVTGMPTEEGDRITHKGCYSVDWHDEQVQVGTMETRGYEEFVDYWIAFNESEGIHDAQWRLDSEYIRDMYLYDGSHGCVNTPLAAMKVVYEHVIDGEAVVVY